MLTNIFLSFLCRNSLQLIFGSIISLQILAHLPLANISIPANAMGSFGIMIEIVSFDYFPITEIVDMGFSPTEPWSLTFALLKYETINFLEGMGSIQICIWLGCLFIIIVLAIAYLRKYKGCCADSKIGKYFNLLKAWYITLGFLQGTFFEVMICLSVSMRIFTIYEYLNAADKFNIANQLFVSIIMLLFILLISYFTLFRMSKLRALNILNKMENHKNHILEVR